MTLFTIFGVIALSIISPFISLFGILTGANIAEVTLPYGPDSGLVWEYDNVDDRYINLKETEIDGDKQIFYFVGNEKSIDYYNGCAMDLIFTDKNGNTETFYAYAKDDGFIQRVNILSEDECSVFEYTAVAEKECDDYKWETDFYYDYPEQILYNPDMEGNDNTFTVIYEHGTDEDDILSLSFECNSKSEDYFEWFFIQIDFSDGEGKLVSEKTTTKDEIYNQQ